MDMADTHRVSFTVTGANAAAIHEAAERGMINYAVPPRDAVDRFGEVSISWRLSVRPLVVGMDGKVGTWEADVEGYVTYGDGRLYRSATKDPLDAEVLRSRLAAAVAAFDGDALVTQDHEDALVEALFGHLYIADDGERFAAVVTDAGGGTVTMLVDRDAAHYPTVGSRVMVRPAL